MDLQLNWPFSTELQRKILKSKIEFGNLNFDFSDPCSITLGLHIPSENLRELSAFSQLVLPVLVGRHVLNLYSKTGQFFILTLGLFFYFRF